MDDKLFIPLTPAALKKRRRDKKISREYMAEFLGVSVPTVTAWEQGKNEPSLDKISLMSEQLDCFFYIPHGGKHWGKA